MLRFAEALGLADFVVLARLRDLFTAGRQTPADQDAYLGLIDRLPDPAAMSAFVPSASEETYAPAFAILKSLAASGARTA